MFDCCDERVELCVVGGRDEDDEGERERVEHCGLAVARPVCGEVFGRNGCDCGRIPAEEEREDGALNEVGDVEREQHEAEQHADEHKDKEIEQERQVEREQRERHDVVDAKAKDRKHRASNQQRNRNLQYSLFFVSKAKEILKEEEEEKVHFEEYCFCDNSYSIVFAASDVDFDRRRRRATNIK